MNSTNRTTNNQNSTHTASAERLPQINGSAGNTQSNLNNKDFTSGLKFPNATTNSFGIGGKSEKIPDSFSEYNAMKSANVTLNELTPL